MSSTNEKVTEIVKNHLGEPTNDMWYSLVGTIVELVWDSQEEAYDSGFADGFLDAIKGQEEKEEAENKTKPDGKVREATANATREAGKSPRSEAKAPTTPTANKGH